MTGLFSTLVAILRATGAKVDCFRHREEPTANGNLKPS